MLEGCSIILAAGGVTSQISHFAELCVVTRARLVEIEKAKEAKG